VAGARLTRLAWPVDEREGNVVEVAALVRVAAERDREPEALLLVREEDAERIGDAARVRRQDRHAFVAETLDVREALRQRIERQDGAVTNASPYLRAVWLRRWIRL